MLNSLIIFFGGKGLVSKSVQSWLSVMKILERWPSMILGELMSTIITRLTNMKHAIQTHSFFSSASGFVMMV
jgi:hypothetical protein